jgi:hypothetical protein
LSNASVALRRAAACAQRLTRTAARHFASSGGNYASIAVHRDSSKAKCR